MTCNALVLGLGDPIMGDDGLGLAALARLARDWDLPPSVSLVDGGTWGMNLLPQIETADQLILLDAIRAGTPPGTLVVIERDELPRYFSLKISPHQIDLREVLGLAELRGTLPAAAVAIGASVLISLSAGFWAGEIFDLSRAMGLLPFFVIGLRVSPAALSWLKTASFRWAAVVGFLVIFTAARFTDQWTVTEVLYYRSSYAQLGGGGLHEMIVRALTLSLGLLGTACFFKLVPSIGGWFAKFGQATLEVYLFHGFFILTAEYAGFPDWAAGHPGLAWLIATVGAVVLALTLAQPPVARVLNVAVDPIGNALKLRRPTKEAKVQGTNGH